MSANEIIRINRYSTKWFEGKRGEWEREIWNNRQVGSKYCLLLSDQGKFAYEKPVSVSTMLVGGQ